MRPLRVLHCPALVGGHAYGLARAERELGLESRTLTLEQPQYGYETDEVLFPEGTRRLARELRRWGFVLRELRSFDVVHFNFGSTLMPSQHPEAHVLTRLYASLVGGADLRALRGTTAVVATYQGDDARQYAARFDALSGYFDPRADEARRASIRRLTRRADHVFALNPDLLAVLPPSATFLPYASVDPREWPEIPPTGRGVPVIVHAPTDRNVKGTDHLVRAVAALRASGAEVELLLVEGVTRDEARAAYEQADLVVDQLITGWYGAVAVEAMALGKPVLAHLHPDDLERVPSELAEELPVIDATPTTVETVLRELVTDGGRLTELGRAGRRFVERWHDPRAVARTTKEIYEAAVRSRAITTTSA